MMLIENLVTGRHGISIGHPPRSVLGKIEMEGSRCRLPGVSSPSFAPVWSETQRHKTSPRSCCCGTPEEAKSGIMHTSHRLPAGHPARGHLAQGRSPGLRIITFIPVFPGLHDPVTRNGTDARRSQLRGQLRHCPAFQRVSPNSRLSPRPLRIARTSNTRYSTRVKISVNNLFAKRDWENGENGTIC